MYEAQHFVDLQNNNAGGGYGGDPKSWLQDHHHSSNTLHQTLSTGTSGNVDPVLYNNLVQMVPLVQSLIVTLSLSLKF